MRLGLHTSLPKNILDLGTGGSHFLAVCHSLGHRTLGTDVELPLYADIAQCLGVQRLIERIEPQKRLIDRGMRFDLVTAIWISFNSLSSTNGKRRYWSLEDWSFLLEDLKDNMVTLPGCIHFELNQEFDDETSVSRFNPELMALFRRMGAVVDEERGWMTLSELSNIDAKQVQRDPRPGAPTPLLVTDSELIQWTPPEQEGRETAWARIMGLGTRLQDRWLGKRFR
jgi:hypothetical protein